MRQPSTSSCATDACRPLKADNPGLRPADWHLVEQLDTALTEGHFRPDLGR
ncbi:hypothetical protein [Streptomyces sp. NPDC052127]|uniref:hypothetical protein n=1 Tax=Streptomyces sp. NPDC052127 TaxID=3155679 RepID=UPI003419E7C6